MTPRPLAPLFDDRLLGQHLHDHANLLKDADTAIDGTLLAQMQNIDAARLTVALKRRAQDAAWRLDIAAEQVDRITERAEQAEAALTTLRAQMRPTAEAAWDEWRQALPSAPQGFTHAHGVRYLQILARHFEALASQEGR